MAAYTTIDKPSDYFNTIIWTGASDTANRAFTGVGFQPDLVWSKIRDDTYHHNWFDSVRGAGSDKEINSDTSGTEGSGDTDGYGFISSFDTDGFSTTQGTASGGRNLEYNQNNNTFVAWNWKAGTSASGNTSGEGTAKSYSSSSNSTSGFSIVKYVGNGTANHAIPHGCGTAPKMIIVKTTTKANQAWPVDCRQGNDGAGGVMYLNETGTLGGYADSSPFTSVAPTSSVFSVGSPGNTNYNDDTYIAYCFAEKSGYNSMKQYIGNNNANGTFVYTGFKPAFVMVKIGDTQTDGWVIQDNKRDISNTGTSTRLRANTSNAEFTSTNEIDLLSNGFKCRGDDGEINGNGSKHIYMAFAENPFVTSTGVPATAR